MTQPFRFIVFSALVALQCVACAGADSDDVGGSTSAEVEIEAVEVAPLDSEEANAPERAKLLSPAERDEQLAMLVGSEPGREEQEAIDPLIGSSLQAVLARAAQLLAEPRVSNDSAR
jgi:hypothetical protein